MTSGGLLLSKYLYSWRQLSTWIALQRCPRSLRWRTLGRLLSMGEFTFHDYDGMHELVNVPLLGGIFHLEPWALSFVITYMALNDAFNWLPLLKMANYHIFFYFLWHQTPKSIFGVVLQAKQLDAEQPWWPGESGDPGAHRLFIWKYPKTFAGHVFDELRPYKVIEISYSQWSVSPAMKIPEKLVSPLACLFFSYLQFWQRHFSVRRFQSWVKGQCFDGWNWLFCSFSLSTFSDFTVDILWPIRNLETFHSLFSPLESDHRG